MNPSTAVDFRVRQRILEAAVRLLSQGKWSSNLLAEAITAAACPADRARRFFREPEDLILALYARIADQMEASVPDLPTGSIANRFEAAMQIKFQFVTPYRDALRTTLRQALDRQHSLGALHSRNEIIRAKNRALFTAVVAGATDRPQPPFDSQLARMLYGVHLILLALWMSGRSANLVRFARSVLSASIGRALLTRLDALVGPRLQPAPPPAVVRTAREVLGILFHHRRLPGPLPCSAHPCAECFALHAAKAERFIDAGLPIHCVLPAFPAKSPSPEKVLGPLPDTAEELALAQLSKLCEEVARVYPPGLQMTICSDGRVFSDVVGVRDEDVTEYGREIGRILERQKARMVEVFHLEDLVDLDNFSAMRDHLNTHYAEPMEVIRRRIREHAHHRALFNGIHRFVFEDRLGVETGKSRSRLREECKEHAYEVIRRSNAWSRLIADCFPGALRFSIHPQQPHSDKIGILLGGESDNPWITPWHAVAVRCQGAFRLMPRSEAEKRGARLIYRDGRAVHYEE